MAYSYPDTDIWTPAASQHLENDHGYKAVVEEAERLLALFTQTSGPKRESIHDHTMLVPGPTQDGWQTKRTIHAVEPRKASNSSLQSRRLTSSPNDPSTSFSQARMPTRHVSIRKDVTVSDAKNYQVDQRTQTPVTGQTAVTSASASAKNACESSTSLPRAKLLISSSALRSSSSPSRSPEPRTATVRARRSARARKDPVTYNIRTLSGLDKKSRLEQDLFGSGNSEGELSDVSGYSHPTSNPPISDLSSIPIQTPKGRSQTANDFRKLLQGREIQGRKVLSRIQGTLSSELKLWKSWKGASNDINTVAWSPDGTRFAAGATAQPDMYNRSNNLVLGDLVRSSLAELPDHWAPLPASVNASDPNATDLRGFSSVIAVQWLGERLYSASYDHTVKIWDVTATPRASCIRTLKHDSKVVVMALSNWMPHFVATGAQGFGLWDLKKADSSPIKLEIRRSANLTPTVLTWGQSAAMSRFLVGGMAQPVQDNLCISQHGHLGLWKIEESEITTRKLSPDSQNIFDIKWHPTMSRFVTASTPGVSASSKLARGYRSVVRLYEYEGAGDRFNVTTEFACPALDINEVTLCPMSTAYVTASCTDGSTYVWDTRNPGKILHNLRHGMSSTPLDHNLDREISDFGVKVALWGSTMDQLYTGGSDCFLKQWDIRRSPEDALIANTANFGHDVVSGAFSEDKSQLLIGDYGGGIHILSCSPCADPDVTDFEFIHATQPASSPEDGVTLANELLTSGQLRMHRSYGPVQGPNYAGPFSRWARGLPRDAPEPPEIIARIPLLEEYQLRQFDGPKVKHRAGLDDKAKKEVRNEIRKAKIRNGRYRRSVAQVRVKRERGLSDEYDDEDGSAESRQSLSEAHDSKRRRIEQGLVPRIITNTDFVDLTQDSDESLEAFDLSPLERLLENLEDDFYFPENRTIDPNFSQDE
ncbi:uncharacterized protein N7477_002017 [Penicillium maclennaniae]|uniref:uncharacterized protein n=1 Tax=Penicillium maclennaniae TaxID=1343394 RepID=UPI00254098CE|nr:uncharacterized protein N7477_002017 [Penicillium maclennaniae]KAJ5682077.1 hypothetical protein N7477_002017 [Penicillium maclennaniae]